MGQWVSEFHDALRKAIEEKQPDKTKEAYDAFSTARQAAKKQLPTYSPVYRTEKAYDATLAEAKVLMHGHASEAAAKGKEPVTTSTTSTPPVPPATEFDPSSFLQQLQKMQQEFLAQQAQANQEAQAKATECAVQAAREAAQRVIAEGPAHKTVEAPAPAPATAPATANTPAMPDSFGTPAGSSTPQQSVPTSVSHLQEQLQILQAQNHYDLEMQRQQQALRAAEMAKIQFQIQHMKK